MTMQGKRQYPYLFRMLFCFTSVLLFASCNNNASPKAAPNPIEPAATAKETAPPQLSPSLVSITHTTTPITEPERAPLLFAIHGLGDTAPHFKLRYGGWKTPATVIYPQAPSPIGRGFSWFQVSIPVTKTDLKTLTADIADSAELLCQFIEVKSHAYPKRRKTFISGFSQGGILSFAVAVTCPQLVDGAFPVGGLLPLSLIPQAAPPNAPPIVAFHGTVDDIVPYDRGEQTISALKQAGYTAIMKPYENVAHDISPQMRRDLYSAMDDLLK